MTDSRATSWPPEAPPEREYEPIQPGSGRGGGWRERARNLFGPIGAGVVLLATKGKAILLLLPKLKIFTTSATMLVSIVAYALIWPWTFALGFVLLLLVHELGHVIQLRREGVEASAGEAAPPVWLPPPSPQAASKAVALLALSPRRVSRRSASLRLRSPSTKSSATSPTR